MENCILLQIEWNRISIISFTIHFNNVMHQIALSIKKARNIQLYILMYRRTLCLSLFVTETQNLIEKTNCCCCNHFHHKVQQQTIKFNFIRLFQDKICIKSKNFRSSKEVSIVLRQTFAATFSNLWKTSFDCFNGNIRFHIVYWQNMQRNFSEN